MSPDSSRRLADLAELERRYDGPVPAGEWPGASGFRLRRIEGVRALHQRLASAAREGAARRRRGLNAAAAGTDPWLARLTLTLAGHRMAAEEAARGY